MWMQLLPNSWQIGIHLRIRLVAAACELSFRLLPRPWRTKGRVKALSGPAKAGALTEVLIRRAGRRLIVVKAGELGGLLKVTICLSSTPAPLQGRQRSVGLGNQRGQVQALRHSLCDPRLILPFVQQFLHPSSRWFACALPLRQRTKWGDDVCSLPTSALPLPPAPLLLLSPEPFVGSLGKLKVTFFLLKWKRPFMALQWYLTHKMHSHYVCWLAQTQMLK